VRMDVTDRAGNLTRCEAAQPVLVDLVKPKAKVLTIGEHIPSDTAGRELAGGAGGIWGLGTRYSFRVPSTRRSSWLFPWMSSREGIERLFASTSCTRSGKEIHPNDRHQSDQYHLARGARHAG